MHDGQSIAVLRQAVLQLRRKETAATAFLAQLKRLHHEAATEADRWSRRTELAQQNSRFDLFLAASERADSFMRKSEQLQNQIEQHVTKLEKLKSLLAIAEKRLGNLEQVQLPSKNKQSMLADIEAIERKLERVLKISEEALKELKSVKAKIQKLEENC